MNQLLSLTEQVVIDRILSNDPPLSGKTKAGMSFTFISAFFVLLGLSFFMYAGFLHLMRNYGIEEAAFMIGGVALGLALLTSLTAYAVLHYKRIRMKRAKQELIQTMEAALELGDEELGEPIRNNPKTSVVLASVAGFLVGERFL